MSDYNDGLLPEPCLRMDTYFGDEYESVEFGDGTGYVKAAPMIMSLWALHAELDELRDENAKLREDLEFERSENSWAREFLDRMGQKCGTKDCPSLVSYVTKMEAENAKLLELVKGLTWCAERGCGIGCHLYDKSEPDHCRGQRLKSELGIEVE